MSDPISAAPGFLPRPQVVDHKRTDKLAGPKSLSGDEVRKAKMRRAAQDFEALFIHKLLKSMRATVPKNDKDKFGMETMREVTDEHLASFLARQGGIGLADVLLRSLERPEGVSTAATIDSLPPENSPRPALVKLPAAAAD